ncbi:MAG: hypothetical protein ACRD12_06520 [Acidimicrobiales bacterium]
MRSKRFRLRRAVMAGVGGVAASITVASLAWACTVPTGTTWYSDGALSKSGPNGTQITAYATGAARNVQFQLVTGDNSISGHSGHACMDNWATINPNWRTSSSSGFIGNTTGTINAPHAGEWQVCFRQMGGSTATSARIFIVT